MLKYISHKYVKEKRMCKQYLAKSKLYLNFNSNEFENPSFSAHTRPHILGKSHVIQHL